MQEGDKFIFQISYESKITLLCHIAFSARSHKTNEKKTKKLKVGLYFKP